MKKTLNIRRFIGVSLILLVLSLFLLPEFAEARRGGRGGSFGGSRNARTTNQQKTQQNQRNPALNRAPQSKTSFGGTRMTRQQAQAKYGTPRSTQQTVGKNAQGGNQTYNVNNYGGYSSGLMTGYLMGHTTMMWMMPFHPAFYYSRPHYVENEDGTIDVYPPTLSFGKIIFGIIILAVIISIIKRIILRARGRSKLPPPPSSFS